uniref:FBJ murine osteosarcoma viral oncogene homolog B n=1 Tax=Hucho hucho TaxID=62062 RepID=A0A4W5NWY3_9TELE
MFQGFPGDFDSVSRGSSSPSIESQYFSSVDSFGSPPASASQDCVSAGGGVGVGSGSGGSSGVDMPGSFVPTVTAITSSQDLQWMVQPTLISSQASGQSGTGTSTMTQSVSLVDPYDLPGPSYSSGSGFTPAGSDTPGPGPAPGPIRQSRTRSRRVRDESLTPEEQEKRRVRRERNKLAAAKCRNRRRELTDRLQGVSLAVFLLWYSLIYQS